MIWRATKLPSREQQVNILSFSLAISQTIVFHSSFGDCVFLLSAFWKHGSERRPFWGTRVPFVTYSVDKSYCRFTTNPLRGGIQVSSAKRQSSVSWNFNRMSKTETKENKMDTIISHIIQRARRAAWWHKQRLCRALKPKPSALNHCATTLLRRATQFSTGWLKWWLQG